MEGAAPLPLVQHAVALDLPERGHQDLSTASTEGATTRHKRDGTRHRDAKMQLQSFEAGGFSQLCFIPPLSLSPPTSEFRKQGHQALKLQSSGQMFFPNLLDIPRSLCNCHKTRVAEGSFGPRAPRCCFEEFLLLQAEVKIN